MRQARYRALQFFRHLRRAPLSPAEQAEAARVLGSPALLALFLRQTPAEQAHALRVLRAVALRAPDGAGRPEALQAALLHDVGKTRAPLNPFERTIAVLGRRLAPGLAARWGQGAARGLRKPFAVAAQHAAWGAELCAEAGAPPLTVSLVRRHQTPVAEALTREDELLRVLQVADDDS